jgi:hypothetical protein
MSPLSHQGSLKARQPSGRNPNPVPGSALGPPPLLDHKVRARDRPVDQIHWIIISSIYPPLGARSSPPDPTLSSFYSEREKERRGEGERKRERISKGRSLQYRWMYCQSTALLRVWLSVREINDREGFSGFLFLRFLPLVSSPPILWTHPLTLSTHAYSLHTNSNSNIQELAIFFHMLIDWSPT